MKRTAKSLEEMLGPIPAKIQAEVDFLLKYPTVYTPLCMKRD